jgi:thiol-disulfide isomerase/thioredoxin
MPKDRLQAIVKAVIDETTHATMEPSTTAPENRRRALWLLVIAPLVIAVLWAWWSATAAPSDQGGVIRSDWFEDHDLARAKARETGRPILVNFTGSDWCGYCIRMREEIFDTGIFAAWAKDHVVLLECDFPRSRQLPRVIVTQNEQLADRFAIAGFPTIVLLDGDGRELTRSGYRRGGAAAWITAFEQEIRRGSESP